MEQRTKELELILNEFFTLDAGHPKRKEMDTFLMSYKSQKDSYEHVKHYMTHSSNQYVYWFALSIVEDKVIRSWSSISSQGQNDIKGFLFDLYINNKTLPPFVFKKLGQVIVDIGRIDFNQNSQEYMMNIMSLVRNPAMGVKGVNLLQYISEEFITSKEVLTQQKKDSLKRLLLEHVPAILDVLTKYLDQLFDQNALKKSKTDVGLPFQVGSPDTNTYSFNISQEARNLTKAVFDALLCYFSWIPLNELLTPSLLEMLFKYIRIERSSIQALTCLNEILSKNCVPKEFEQFLLRIFHQIFSLMTDITTGNGIAAYSGEFIEKFTQFISLFVANHLKRVENNPSFHITNFLGLLFQYTFIQQSVEAFDLCLDIWMMFLDCLLTNGREQSLPGSSKYTDGLIMLQSELVKRVLNAYNSQLAQLDDCEEVDNEMEPIASQHDLFIRDCIEIIVKITEIYPNKGLENLYPLFAQNVTTFFGKLEELIQNRTIDQNDSKLRTSNYIYQKLIDMCAFSSINATFRFGSEWEKLQVQILNTLRSFSYWLGEYGNQVRASPAQQQEFDTIVQKLISTLVQMFDRTVPEKVATASGRLMMSLAITTKPLNLFAQMDGIICNIHNICTPLPVSVQCVVYSAVCNAILNPPSNVNLSTQFDSRRPKCSPFIKGITGPYLEIPQIPGLVENKIFMKDEVIQRVQRVLKILTAVIKSVPDSNLAKGILHDAIQDTLGVTLGLFRIYVNKPDILESILDFFFTLFESLKSKVGVAFTQQTISTFLEILGGNNIKNLLGSGSNETGNVIIKKLIEILTFVIQTYGHSFDTLLSSIIQFSMEHIYPVIINSTNVLRPLFFTLLYSILDNHWKHFFPSSTSSSSSSSSSSSTNALMFGNTSNSNGIVVVANGNGNVNGNGHVNGHHDSAASQRQLESIMMAFQTTFQQNDVNLFKQNLDYFDKLNAKYKLYERITMQEKVFGCSFVAVFFDILLSKSHSVHSEEIINTIYNFASVDFNRFFNDFFNTYLNQKNINDEHKRSIRTNFTADRDQPTFNKNMNQFVNDVSFYTYVSS
ncbi:hypothetical protein SAMD00019534_123320 [Acytostelium subglobosum LB1]|uniref:hypothetical protein n=1 Tax=Acytostelium subglobosum LB1 TaxID=1410327 RepID=UPI000644A36E|nr:hypothetical protein SAMD00019534_123320 [Acytostelium subglobosum LB1]GAM29156.1 hypothetical protein SAMD00019534_123320 [Acytostelium subglobosum LB1]|eukprot:XP_012747847.1 hypothetical protein SAMD00019534_123320 [Acytostelium subglobosum LB1]